MSSLYINYVFMYELRCDTTRYVVPSGTRLTASYFCSVTGYDMLASFTALAGRVVLNSRDQQGNQWFRKNVLKSSNSD